MYTLKDVLAFLVVMVIFALTLMLAAMFGQYSQFYMVIDNDSYAANVYGPKTDWLEHNLMVAAASWECTGQLEEDMSCSTYGEPGFEL